MELVEALQQVSLPSGVSIQAFQEEHFEALQALCQAEGWTSFIHRPDEALAALLNSQVALVAFKNDQVVGYLRAISDGFITTYLAEILVNPEARGQHIGSLLLDVCHAMYPRTRIDLLSTELAGGFYKGYGFREYSGFRKSYV